MYRKIIGITVCMLFFGANIVPCISGNVEQIKNSDVIKSEMISNLDSNLVGYWSFDEGSGDTVYDSSGNGNDGTIYGATWTTGISGYALDFDGSDDYVNINSADDYMFVNQSVTFSVWIQLVDNTDEYRKVFELGDENDKYPSIALNKCRSGYNEGRVAAQKYPSYPGGGQNDVYTIENGNELPKNEWLYFTFVIDYENTLFSLYLNAELQESEALIPYNMSESESFKFNIGLEVWDDPGWSNHWKGLIDEFRVYEEALSEDEIEYLYKTGVENQPPVADFNWTPEKPKPSETIIFDASDSYDSNGYIMFYEWDWDDDGVFDENHTNPTVTHSWPSEGFYSVTLKVTDNRSISGLETKIVRVGKDELDQSQTDMDFFAPVGNIFLAPEINYITAQSYIPTLNILTRVEILTGKNSSASYDFTLAIRDDLLGPDLTSLSLPPGDFVTENFSWLEFDFNDISVNPGTTYYIVCYTYDDPDNWYAWGAELSDVYPYGSVWWSEDDGETFEEDPDADLTFKTYGYDNQPPTAPIINGPNNGKPNTEYDFTFNSTDPYDNDIAEYIVEWGDGSGDETIVGPFASGEEATGSHSWTSQKTFTIKVKAKDVYGAESGWTSFDIKIEIPRNRATVYSFFLQLFERFPLLEKLLSLIRASFEYY